MVGCQGFVLCHLVAAYIACTVLYYIVVPWEQQGVVLHENFSLQQYTHIKEYDCHCALYRHIPTGAQVISVRAQDTNKVFGIAFRTPPPDSTGVAHVLEHSVLCGSEKYKTKEPFVDLLRGSLQTFLNAMTWPDRTVYPVASQNVKDLYNLADVYVDAVFHPRAAHDEHVLKQEGWHYELNNVDDDLEFKGVVYNEMKGVYSNAESLMGRRAQQLLFPDVRAYHVDSGGDPEEIPNLTYEKFLDFYHKFYSPSNARVWMYGDHDEMDRLSFVDERLTAALSADDQGAAPGHPSLFDALESAAVSRIDHQPLKTLQQWHKYPYAATSEQMNEHFVSVNWVCTGAEPLSELDSLLVSVLDHLLVGNSASLLQKLLTESGLGTRVIDDGFDFTLQQGVFSVGMAGVPNGSQQELVDLVLLALEQASLFAKNGSFRHAEVPDTFVADLADATMEASNRYHRQLVGVDAISTLVNASFSESAIEAAINILEFRMRELKSSRPRGLTLMLSVMRRWNYDRSPFDGLFFERSILELRQNLSHTQTLLGQLLDTLLVSNSHRVTVEMFPDDNFQKTVEEKEKKRLSLAKADIVKDSNSDALSTIVEETKTLKQLQQQEDSAEAKATIPHLSLDDIDPVAPNRYSTVVRDDAGCRIDTHSESDAAQSTPCFTLLTTTIPESNSIVYVDIAFDLRMLSVAELKLLPLFCNLVMDSGTDTGLSRVDIMQLKDSKTGGISLAPSALPYFSMSNNVVPDSGSANMWLFLRAKALESQIEDLFDLCELLLLHARLDDPARAVEFLKQRKADLENAIPSRGHAYANTWMRGRFSLGGALEELLHGIASYEHTAELLRKLEIVGDESNVAGGDADGEKSDARAQINLDEWATLLQSLRGIRSKVMLQQSATRNVGQPKRYANLASTAFVISEHTDAMTAFLSRLETGARSTFHGGLKPLSHASTSNVVATNPGWVKWWKNSLKVTESFKAFVLPTQVNYVGMAIPLVHPGQSVKGQLLVVNKLLQMGYLWDRVRVSGGAYGGFSVLDIYSGVLSLLSYRDPNFCDTLLLYHRISDFLLNADFPQSDIERAIIGTIGDLDQPESADAAARSSLKRYLMGVRPEDRDSLRTQVLATEIEDIRSVGHSIGAVVTKTASEYASASIVSASSVAPDEEDTFTCVFTTSDAETFANELSFAKVSLF